MKKINFKKLIQVLTPKERAKLVAGYYIKSDDDGKIYQNEVDQLKSGLSREDSQEYAFYANIIHEINFTIGSDLQTIFLKLIICHQSLSLIVGAILFIKESEDDNDGKFDKRIDELIAEIKRLYSLLLGYVDGIEALERQFFDGVFVISRKIWLAKYAKQEYQDIKKSFEVFFSKNIEIGSNIKLDENASNLMQERIVNWAINDSGYKP